MYDDIKDFTNPYTSPWTFYFPDGKLLTRLKLCEMIQDENRKFIKHCIKNCLPFPNYLEIYKRILHLTTEPPPAPKPPKRSKHHKWINVYLKDRAYGGPEEGGWWYDYAVVEFVIKVSNKRVDQELKIWKKWCEEENGNRRSDIGSMLSEGCYYVVVEDFPGKNWPAVVPHYE